jgi:hypothetical protein
MGPKEMMDYFGSAYSDFRSGVVAKLEDAGQQELV